MQAVKFTEKKLAEKVMYTHSKIFPTLYRLFNFMQSCK